MNVKKYLETGNKVRKEHILKLCLWIAGITLNVLWLAFAIATSISSGQRLILSNEEVAINVNQISNLKDYLQNTNYVVSNLTINEASGVLEAIQFKRILYTLDWNPLCLTYKASLTGWYLLVLLAPVGYMGCIYIVAIIKNMITPQAIKKANRKALQFGYLDQQSVNYICNEIDYNTGEKIRPEKEANEVLDKIKELAKEGN